MILSSHHTIKVLETKKIIIYKSRVFCPSSVFSSVCSQLRSNVISFVFFGWLGSWLDNRNQTEQRDETEGLEIERIVLCLNKEIFIVHSDTCSCIV